MKSNTTQDAAVRLMLKFPFWSELYYTMTIYDDPDCPTLSTDGRNMWVNPTFWAGLTLPLKIAALAHEIGHKMLLHSTRRGSRNPMLWNIAADYVVNASLPRTASSWARAGSMTSSTKACQRRPSTMKSNRSLSNSHKAQEEAMGKERVKRRRRNRAANKEMATMIRTTAVLAGLERMIPVRMTSLSLTRRKEILEEISRVAATTPSPE